MDRKTITFYCIFNRKAIVFEETVVTSVTHLILTHLYSLISKTLQIFNPHQMPNPLHTKTSKIRESHQHSKKLGNKWANAISVISHIMDIAQRNPACLNKIALNIHPKKWPHANTSTWDHTFAKLISEQLTAYSWKLKKYCTRYVYIFNKYAFKKICIYILNNILIIKLCS